LSVTYTKEQRALAKQLSLRLCTISTPAMSVQGPMTTEEAKEIEQFLYDFVQRRMARRAADREQQKPTIPRPSTAPSN
jgi:hypothetical protein